MTDHKAKAESFIATELVGGSFDQTRDYIALAQVHATLYLAEQQRIANIIAMVGLNHSAGFGIPSERFDEIWEGVSDV